MLSTLRGSVKQRGKTSYKGHLGAQSWRMSKSSWVHKRSHGDFRLGEMFH